MSDELTNLRAFARAFHVTMCGGKGTPESWAELGAYAAKMAAKFDAAKIRNEALQVAVDVCKSRARSFPTASEQWLEAGKCARVIESHMTVTEQSTEPPTPPFAHRATLEREIARRVEHAIERDGEST